MDLLRLEDFDLVPDPAETDIESPIYRTYLLQDNRDGRRVGAASVYALEEGKSATYSDRIDSGLHGGGYGSILLVKFVALVAAEGFPLLIADIEMENKSSLRRFERLADNGLAIAGWFNSFRSYSIPTHRPEEALYRALLPPATGHPK